MSSTFQELSIELARQRALNLLFDEYQKTPERDLEVIDFKQIRRSWVVTFKSQEFPDVLMIVEFDSGSKQTQTQLYERRTRASATVQEPVLFEI